MTDKVQKILSEIATRKLCTMDEHMAFYNDAAKEDYRFLSEIEELINVLQENPVSEDLDSFAIKYAQDKPYPVTVCQSVKVGANWQNEQIIKRLCNHANIDQMVEKFEYKYKPENLLDTEYYKRGIFDTIKAIKED